ncbi:hypothetical protein KP509_20G049900 [Ceratopteris richardii]|uniref:Amino acid transporter transmembrane domain-containing protein n=1 Tax=Ceratopteris richardii TaxID=49495 RepID=A0A8T2SIJ8_CERRI|nr:hypothetical protein KP509_20G049900 [Ceratopteris richardii]
MGGKARDAEEEYSLYSVLLEDHVPLASKPLCSASRTFANLFLVIVGVGVLSVPYTFSKVGWVYGILSLLVGGTLSYYGMMLQLYSKYWIQKSRGELGLVITSYGDLAFHTMGTWGRLSVDILLTLGTLSGAIAHMAFIGHNVASIASSMESTHVNSIMRLDSSFIVAPCTGLHNVTCSHGAMQNNTVWKPSFERPWRISLENHDLPQHGDVNQTFFELVFEHESEDKDGGSSAVYLSLLVHRLACQFLTRIDWTHSSIYIWCMFPLVLMICAIPSIMTRVPLSAVANTLNITALIAIMASDVPYIIKTSGFRHMRALGDIVSVPSAIAVGVYSFQASGIMIPLESSMVKPSKFGVVMATAITVIGLLYCLLAVLCYAAFGIHTEQIITLNLQSGLDAVLIKSAISSSVLLGFPLVLTPLFELAERRFTRRKASIGLRALVLFLVCLLSTTVKQFAVFLSLSGSSISCLLGFILPAIIHIKAMRESGSKQFSILPLIADYSLVMFGLVFGLFGTVHSLMKFL